MTVTCEVVGNVVATYWDGVISVDDARQVVSKTDLAYSRTHEPLVGVAIMAPTAKRPTLDAGKFMYANHPKMRELHRSIHIVILARGLVASSLKSFVTLGFFDGTGGKLSVHDGVKEAWEEAAKFGPMHVPRETVLARLRAHGAALPLNP